MGILVHPQSGLLCGAALPGALVSEQTYFRQKMIPARGPQTKLNVNYLCVLRTCIFQSSRRAVSGQCQPI